MTPGSDSHSFGKVKASAANCPHAGQAGGGTFSWLLLGGQAGFSCPGCVHRLDLQTGAETLKALFVV